MSALTIAETLASEAVAKANGWSEEQLLNLAGERLGRAIGRFFPRPGTVVGYLGKGHNAGDTLVALRILRDEFGWDIAARLAFPISECAPLTRMKWVESGISLPLDRMPAWRGLKRPLLLLDGLLGSGSRGSLREPLLELAREISNLRRQAGARVAAVDIPSGIDPDSGRISPDPVTADVTFMIGNAKLGLLTGQAATATGALAVVSVEPLTVTRSGPFEIISPQTLEFAKSPRPFDFHKGMAGRVAIVAGSRTYTGAAVLAASGALRGGAGLVTLFVPAGVRHLVASSCPPEVIVREIEKPRDVLEFRCDSMVIGCGLGQLDSMTEDGLLELISYSTTPTVVDADALNLLARTESLGILSDRHVLTPHPGEFARLAPDLAGLTREEAARRFSDERCAGVLMLKGCRTLVTRKGAALWCNSTGTPAMATGGQGDLLAGVIGARLAIGDAPMEAAALSAWLCGRAAEIAMQDANSSEESLIPSDVLRCLGGAFGDWKSCSR
jgi:ADP-dependent NAD(P)H-hydrate dehydratase / NAD(P)H-hydrate epimerase